MNHCRDCNSDYATPGTCNCFAVGGKRYANPCTPYIQYIQYIPYIPHYPQPTYVPPFTITTTPNPDTTWLDIKGGSFAGVAITGRSTSLAQSAAFSGGVFTTGTQS